MKNENEINHSRHLARPGGTYVGGPPRFGSDPAAGSAPSPAQPSGGPIGRGTASGPAAGVPSCTPGWRAASPRPALAAPQWALGWQGRNPRTWGGAGGLGRGGLGVVRVLFFFAVSGLRRLNFHCEVSRAIWSVDPETPQFCAERCVLNANADKVQKVEWELPVSSLSLMAQDFQVRCQGRGIHRRRSAGVHFPPGRGELAGKRAQTAGCRAPKKCKRPFEPLSNAGLWLHLMTQQHCQI